jgi:hypothetical protein
MTTFTAGLAEIRTMQMGPDSEHETFITADAGKLFANGTKLMLDGAPTNVLTTTGRVDGTSNTVVINSASSATKNISFVIAGSTTTPKEELVLYCYKDAVIAGKYHLLISAFDGTNTVTVANFTNITATGNNILCEGRLTKEKLFRARGWAKYLKPEDLDAACDARLAASNDQAERERQAALDSAKGFVVEEGPFINDEPILPLTPGENAAERQRETATRMGVHVEDLSQSQMQALETLSQAKTRVGSGTTSKK